MKVTVTSETALSGFLITADAGSFAGDTGKQCDSPTAYTHSAKLSQKSVTVDYTFAADATGADLKVVILQCAAEDDCAGANL